MDLGSLLRSIFTGAEVKAATVRFLYQGGLFGVLWE
jgi:hypothetical protein